MGRIANIVPGLKPAILMVLVQVIFAGINVMSKLAANDGMNLRIMVAYRFMFATVVMMPLALFLERKSLRKISWMVLFQAFLCGLFGGSLGQGLYLQSLVYTSATFVSAMVNLSPAVTFILGICFKLEKLAIGTLAGKAKVLGTLIGIGGAMIFIFYKGIDITIWSTNVNLLHHRQPGGSPGHSSNDTGKFILGAFLGLLSCISFVLWLIIQAKMIVKFPYHYSTTALMCIMGSIQGAVFALCTEKDSSQWKLGWNVRLLAVAYLGIMGSALMVFMVSWGVHLRGPLYASIFNPLGLVFVAIVGSLLLDEKLHLGSVIGAVLIVMGLYVVLWGKGKELKKMNQLVPSSDTNSPENGDIEIIVTSSDDHNTSVNNNYTSEDSPMEKDMN
ncbi:hypothetical protein DITRI_Ditri01bG0024700 [Diplodiscus trichospermus]